MPVTAIDIAFDVVRVEFPVGSVRHSLKLWNHIDGMRLESILAASMARNGFQCGVGVPQAWPALQAIIDSGQAQVTRDQLVAPRGQPLAIELGAVSEGTPMFAFDRSGRLAGKSFESGRFTLIVDYAYSEVVRRSVDIVIGLEVRTDHGVMTWERNGGVIKQVPSIDRHVFDGVRASANLAEGEFLVIGPNEDQSGDYVVGHQCFSETSEGETTEIVLFLAPRLVGWRGPSGVAHVE